MTYHSNLHNYIDTNLSAEVLPSLLLSRFCCIRSWAIDRIPPGLWMQTQNSKKHQKNSKQQTDRLKHHLLQQCDKILEKQRKMTYTVQIH